MPDGPTLMRALITGRHWQKYSTFEAQFRRAAKDLATENSEPDLKGITVSRRQFERWYAGRVKTEPHPDACRVLEHMFGYPVHQLLGAANQIIHAPGAVESQRHEAPDIFSPGTLGELESAGIPACTYDDNVGRGNEDYPTGSFYALDPERMLLMAAKRAVRFSVTADSSNVGPASLDMLRSETGRLVIAYPQQPLSIIIADIVSLQDSTFTLLEGRQRPRETRDLYVIGGLVSGMLGKASHDLRDPYGAMTHARTAMLCAQNAEHDGLAAWVYGLQSLITYWADRPRDALEYAQIGSQLPETHGSVKVWLASLEARAWSVLGNSAEGMRAIEKANDLREQVTGDDLDSLGGICNFSRPRQLYYAADAGASLPDSLAAEKVSGSLYKETETYAAEAIAAYENSLAGERSFGDEAGARTDLAVARIRSRDLEGAAEAVRDVLSLPASRRIHGVVGSVVKVHRAITAASSDAPAAKELQEEIENYCRTPAAALPS